MRKWRPIEKAPKDRAVLVYMEGGVFQATFDPSMNEWMPIRASSHGCGCCSYANDAPSHWMPLPPHPMAHEADLSPDCGEVK